MRKFFFVLTAMATMLFAANAQTVSGSYPETMFVDVYTMYGKLVKKDFPVSQINTLQKGVIYIIDGKKVSLR